MNILMKQLFVTTIAILLAGSMMTQSTAKAPDISINQAIFDGNIEVTKQHLAGGVDVNKAGEYQLKYNVVDASGNKSLELTRRVIVKTTSKESIRIEKHNSVPFWFEFKSKKEMSYAIESSKDLRAWEEIKIINGTGEMIRFEDERDQVFPEIYYRVKVVN